MTPGPDDDAVALGTVLIPALASGALLAHPASQAEAAALVRTLADDPALVGELEDAVLHAHALIDANVDGGADLDGRTALDEMVQRTKDALLGCLRPEAVVSPELVARLARMGPDGPPRIDPPTMTSFVTSSTTTDRLRAEGIELNPQVVSIADRLGEQLTLARNARDARPDDERRLPDVFVEADRAFAQDESLSPSLLQLLVDAADVLAHDQRVGPDGALGQRIVQLLTEAAEQPDAGSFLGEERVWSPGFRDRGVSGLTTLLRRPDWRETDARPDIVRLVRDALTDGQPPRPHAGRGSRPRPVHRRARGHPRRGRRRLP